MPTRYDPFDPAQVDDHFDVLAAIRAEDPVAEVMPGVFYVSRREDIVAVSRSHATFVQGGFEPLEEDHRSLDERELGETDPPFHTIVRRNLAPFFGPRHTATFEPLVREACDRLIEGFSGRGHADLIGDFAAPLPAQVIGRLSGIPSSDLPRVRGYSDDFIYAKVHAGTEEAEAAAGRCAEFDEHLRDVIASRRRSAERPDDLLTTLIECRDDEGDPISDQRILTHLSKDVLIGGVETTTHFVGNLFFQVLSEPGLYGELRADRSLVPPSSRSRSGTSPPSRWCFDGRARTPRWPGSRSRRDPSSCSGSPRGAATSASGHAPTPSIRGGARHHAAMWP